MKWKPLPRRLVLTSAFGAVMTAGVFSGRWLGQPGMAARAAADLDADALFRGQGDPVMGNPAGVLPMAEFFDYRCPYCRRMHPLLRRLLNQVHDVRFIAKEWPIFGGPSIAAARVALAANWQGKFAAINDALFDTIGELNHAKIRAAAEKGGLDMDRLNHELSARNAQLDAVLRRVSDQANALGLQGTPGFVIGSYLVPGALSYDDLLKVVSDARAKLQSGPNQHVAAGKK